MLARPTASTAGVLRPAAVTRQVDVRRCRPSEDVAAYVERYWSVRWSRPPRDAYAVHVIPPPSINITFSSTGGAHAHGVDRRLSTHELSGAGWVFGLKFRAGGFRSLTGVPAADLTDDTVGLRELIGPEADRLTDAVLAAPTDRRRLGLVEEFLRTARPRSEDHTLRLVGDIVSTMVDERTLTRVDDISRRFALSARTIQRMFRQYVGVGPKFVLQRCRLQDAAGLLAAGTVRDLSALALQLGYVDQAHFTRDFTTITGTSPAAYAQACQDDAVHGSGWSGRT